MSSRNASPSNFIFVGPTLHDTSLAESCAAAGFRVMPPAQRGDVAALLGGEPGTIVLVDGRFHQSLAVGHAELRRAIEDGWNMWGLSSMGAIRAYEMAALGMRGFGLVYSYFHAVADFQDDEVALLHAPEAPYAPVTEPLIHYRHWLAHLVAVGIIGEDVASDIVADLKARWFGERTTAAVVSSIRRLAGDDACQAARQAALDLSPFRVKTHDLEAFVSGAVWQSPVENDAALRTQFEPPPFSSATALVLQA